MKINSEIIDVNKLSYNLIQRRGNENNVPILFLHGFTGSALDWKEVIELLPPSIPATAIDLIGHGKSAAPEDLYPYKEENQIDCLNSIIKIICKRKPILAGYSMGGRLALKYALKYNSVLSGLIIESGTAGITGKSEKAKRCESDNAMASDILNFGIGKFIDEWMNKPLFNSLRNLPEQKYASLIQTKKMNSPTGLANSLKIFGSGNMKNAWDDLPELNLPALLICGELDLKFKEITKRMNKLIPGSEMGIIPSAGHNTHLEKPADFVNFVLNFWNKINYRNE